MAIYAPNTGAPSRAPNFLPNYRADALDASALLSRIETFLPRTSIAATTFGRQSVRDPRLLLDLRRGARMTPRRAARIVAFMEGR